jgi:tetratricopeptide (TPR) repeat protein
LKDRRFGAGVRRSAVWTVHSQTRLRTKATDMSAEPKDQLHALQRTSALCEHRRFPEAIALASSIITRDPQNPHAWCLMAQAQLGHGKNTAALQAARAAVSLAPERDWPQRLSSLALTRLGRHDQAARAAERAVRLAPDNAQAYALLAHAHVRVGERPLDAQLAAKRAVELGPTEVEPHIAAGAVAAAAGRRDDAADAFNRALAIDPQNSEARHQLARLDPRERVTANAKPARPAAAATAVAAPVGADPRGETSRRNLEAGLGRFLKYTAYLIVVDALIARNAAFHSATTTISPLLPVLVLALPAAFALWFVGQLPTHLRPYVLEPAFTGRFRIATGCMAIAVVLIVITAVAPQADRPSMSVLAATFAFLGRVALRYARRRVQKSPQTLA